MPLTWQGVCVCVLPVDALCTTARLHLTAEEMDAANNAAEEDEDGMEGFDFAADIREMNATAAASASAAATAPKSSKGGRKKGKSGAAHSMSTSAPAESEV